VGKERTKSVELLLTVEDELEVERALLDAYPSVVFVDQLAWVDPNSPPARSSIAECSDDVTIWNTAIHPTIAGSRRDNGVVDGPEVGPVIQWLRCWLDSSGVLQAGRWAASFNTDNTDMTRFVAEIWRIVLKKTTNKLVRAGAIDGPVYRNVAERHFHVGQHAMALATSGVITLASNRMRLLPEHAA
jgi:hypothetical protein